MYQYYENKRITSNITEINAITIGTSSMLKVSEVHVMELKIKVRANKTKKHQLHAHNKQNAHTT